MLVSYALAVVQEGPEATAVEVIQDRQQEMLVKLEGRRELRDESDNLKTESVIWDVSEHTNIYSVPVFLLGCFLLSFVKCIESNSILSILSGERVPEPAAGWLVCAAGLRRVHSEIKWNPERSGQTASAEEVNVGETTNLDCFTIIISNVCFVFLSQF